MPLTTNIHRIAEACRQRDAQLVIDLGGGSSVSALPVLTAVRP